MVLAAVDVAMSVIAVVQSFRALSAAMKMRSPANKHVKVKKPEGGTGIDLETGCNAGDCFIAGTKVLTEDGYKNIEDIEVGDKVLAYDEKTGEQAYKKVVQLFRGETKEWYHVFVDGEEIVCTGNHPFYVEGKGFVKAKDLTTEEKLTLSDGKQVEIEKIEIEKLDKPETKYNFEVEGFHTYYVTEKAILVHNDCISDKLTEIANKYEDFQCVEAADEMSAFLKSQGITPQQVQLQFTGAGRHNNVWSETLGRTISYNGYHTGIVYQGKVYDNLFKKGLSYNKWIDDFIGFGQKLIF